MPVLTQHGLLEEVEEHVAPTKTKTYDASQATASMVSGVNMEVQQLKNRLGQTEDLVLERDHLVEGLEERLENLFASVQDLSAQVRLTTGTVTQRAVLAITLLPIELEKARRRMYAGVKDENAGESAAFVGAAVGVSRETVRKAILISRKAPRILEAMRQGNIKSMEEALRLAGLKKKTDLKSA